MSPQLRERYSSALREYLEAGGEAPLVQAYDIGRQMLAAGEGLLSLISFHQSALLEIIESHPSAAPSELVQAAGLFLLESLSPFEALQLDNREVNAALRRLNSVLEEEAKRIAYVLHDEAAQMLATAYLELAALAQDADAQDADATRERVDRVTGHLDLVREQLRRLSHELRPPVLDQLGLLPALRFLADGVRQRSQLDVTVTGAIKGRWPSEVETAVYRVVQEALNNVIRHAHASQVQIRVRVRDHTLHCSVEDDGVGSDSGKGTQGLGLMGIQERVRALNGTVALASKPGNGMTLGISIPRPPDPGHPADTRNE